MRRARHIEVQVFGDGDGGVVALGERDCSLQRAQAEDDRGDTPARTCSAKTRQALIDAALRLTKATRYRSAGTVEFLYDPDRDDFFFLEVNTRLQVEHWPVTEQVRRRRPRRMDELRGAAGDFGFLKNLGRNSCPRGASGPGHPRLYAAEDPGQDYEGPARES